jgi:anti-anti-sigma factor
VAASLTLAGDITFPNTSEWFNRLMGQIEAQRETLDHDEIEIDCSAVTYLDSSALAMLLKLRHRTDRDLVLIDLPVAQRRPFEITGLTRLFQFR